MAETIAHAQTFVKHPDKHDTFQARGRYLEEKINSWMKKPTSRQWLLTMCAAVDALHDGYPETARRIAGMVGEAENLSAITY